MLIENWKLKPGDIICLHQDQEVPADIVLLISSEPSNAVYINTVQLDGESNIKVKSCIPDFSNNLIANYDIRCVYSVVSSVISSFRARIISLSTMTPISIVVEIEILRACQHRHLKNDEEMKDIEIKNLSIVEYLGNITHIFSDKTGTLTKNIMQLQGIVLDDFFYVNDPSEELNQFQKKLMEAKFSNGVEDHIQSIYSSLEKSLEYVGCTGIDDKLHDDVPEVIQSFQNAGIKFWVLTGDKVDTALAIARSSSIIKPTTNNIMLVDSSLDELRKTMEETMAFIIAGQLASIAFLKDEDETFLNLAKSVIACRLTPIQKAKLIEKCKKYCPEPNLTSLAVGDGANDASMIVQADVGVGIQSLDGSQAARISDVSIPNFCYLRKLLLYYGHQFHRKNIDLTYLSFFKSFIFAFANFYLSIATGASGSSVNSAIRQTVSGLFVCKMCITLPN
ncbi:uncharacterized protein LOC142597996 [Dermatophagoides farinae]|uniref:uncharacterized protein LOC142597996 n=1 Tax=Dermatophagoides farinae TaxID=6954 RepID=UPI003F5EDBC2